MPVNREDFKEVKRLIAKGKESAAISFLLKKSTGTKIEFDVVSLSNQYQIINHGEKTFGYSCRCVRKVKD